MNVLIPESEGLPPLGLCIWKGTYLMTKILGDGIFASVIATVIDHQADGQVHILYMINQRCFVSSQQGGILWGRRTTKMKCTNICPQQADSEF